MIRIIFCILCVRVFVFLLLLLLLSVYFSFFQCSWFSVSSSVFFSDAPSSFFAFYTLDFVTYMFETPFTEMSLPSIRNGTYVMYGTYIEPTLLHFCLVACYSVTLSKTVNSLVEKRLLSVVYFGRRPHESGEKKWGFKNVKIRVDMAFRPR